MDNTTMSGKFMRSKPVRMIFPFLKKYREILLYIIFVGAALLLNNAMALPFEDGIISFLYSRAHGWIVCVVLQFIVNKYIVFRREVKGNIWLQMLKFAFCCLLTLSVQIILIVELYFTFVFSWNMIRLILCAFAVIVNYLVCKFWVFK